MALPGGPELLVVLVIVLVLFGGAKLPQLARNLSRAQRELRSGHEPGPDETSQGPDAGTR